MTQTTSLSRGHWVSAMREAEARVGIEPLDEILAERNGLVDEIAPLWARLGPGGTADHELSAERCKAIAVLRAQAAERGEKVTEAALEAGGRTHPAYLEMMTNITKDRAELFDLQERLQQTEWRYQRSQALLKAYASEPK